MKGKKKLIIAIVLVVLLGILIFAIVSSNKANEITISFDTNGASKMKKQAIKKGDKLEEPEEPEKEGYEFIGWYYDGEKFDFDQEITEDIKLEAKWIKVSTIKYTVTFDSNGGSAVESQKVKNGKKATKPENPTRYGYTFGGWTLDGESYSFSSKVTKNITLKAVWNRIYSSTTTTTTTTPVQQVKPVVQTFSVTFVLDSQRTSVVKVEKGKTVAQPTTPILEDYLFVKWVSNNSEFDFSTPITSDIEITAVWKSTVAEVATLDELKESLANSEVTKIELTDDITGIDETLRAVNKVTINGNDKTLEFTDLDSTTENGSGLLLLADDSVVNDLKIEFPATPGFDKQYGIEAYDVTGIVINNYTGTGADAALLVNGSEVELTGVTTLTGNELVGIEASKADDLTNNSTLTVTGTIVMTDETLALPAIWALDDEATVVGSLREKEMTLEGKTYYINNSDLITVANVGTLDELKAALANTDIETINITSNITGIDETLRAVNKVTINGGNNTLTFTDLDATLENGSGLLILADDSVVNNLNITFPGTAGFNSQYGIEVYDATGVVINNYTGTGADAAILVNGSEVELTGTITVTGSESGGIQALKDDDLTNNSTLTVTGTIVIADESATCPAVFITNGEATVVSTLTEVIKTDETYYFVNAGI